MGCMVDGRHVTNNKKQTIHCQWYDLGGGLRRPLEGVYIYQSYIGGSRQWAKGGSTPPAIRALETAV